MTIKPIPASSPSPELTSTAFSHASEPIISPEELKAALEQATRSFQIQLLQHWEKRLDQTNEATVQKDNDVQSSWEVDLDTVFGELDQAVKKGKEVAKDLCRKLPREYRSHAAQMLAQAFASATAFIAGKIRIAVAVATGLTDAIAHVFSLFLAALRQCVKLANANIHPDSMSDTLAVHTTTCRDSVTCFSRGRTQS